MEEVVVGSDEDVDEDESNPDYDNEDEEPLISTPAPRGDYVGLPRLGLLRTFLE